MKAFPVTPDAHVPIGEDMHGLRLVCWCAYSSIADIFVTVNVEPQTEGMFGATLWTTRLNPSPIRVSTVPYACKP